SRTDDRRTLPGAAARRLSSLRHRTEHGGWRRPLRGHFVGPHRGYRFAPDEELSRGDPHRTGKAVALGAPARQGTSLSAARIVGIVLVRNEDLFVETAVRNIVAFCDEIRIADHGSTDATPRILRSLAGSSPKIHVESISHPAASHALIRNLAGSATWVFGVDGDEIYEPDRLARLRQRILRGEFDRHWMLLGN